MVVMVLSGGTFECDSINPQLLKEKMISLLQPFYSGLLLSDSVDPHLRDELFFRFLMRPNLLRLSLLLGLASL